jgi:hypothetical protein
MLMLE